jgi:hypothetical protein
MEEACTCLGNDLFSVLLVLATASFTLLAGLTTLLPVSFRFLSELLGCTLDGI